MQQYPGAQFNRNPASHQDRQQHPLFARGGFSSELRHKDIGSGDLASSLSLPTSSGTEGRGGSGVAGVGRGPNKRKGGRSRKPPPNESQAMQRCLDVVEQLLEEEDAEPFAEPVSSLCSSSCATCLGMLHLLLSPLVSSTAVWGVQLYSR